MDPFEIARLWGSFAMFAVILPPALLALAIPYAVLRLRSDSEFDRQVGFNAALQFFCTLSVLVFLTGLTILVVDFIWSQDLLGRRGNPFQPPMQRVEFPNDAQRTAFALILSGAFFGMFHFFAILTFIDHPFTSSARRLFIGCRFAIHGLVVLFALTALLVLYFQRGERGILEMQTLLGVLIVWMPSWVVHFALLCQRPVALLRPEFDDG